MWCWLSRYFWVGFSEQASNIELSDKIIKGNIMSKVLYQNGGFSAVEDNGVVTLSESISVGGGNVAGFMKVLPNGVQIDGNILQAAAFAVANAKLVPAPLLGAAIAVEGVIEAAEKAIE